MGEKILKKNKFLFTFLVVSAVLLIGSLFYLSRNHFEDEYVYTPPTNNIDNNAQNITETESQSIGQNEKKDLQYLIEEEKLAYDLYTVFYNEYGSRVFGNILESESTHQDRVLSVMQSMDIDDPRTGEPGKFSDKSLQDLYDELTEKGLSSLQEAFKVGVTIEEKDIADLNTMINQSEDDVVIAMLQELKNGSEKHLAAFNRQL